VVILGIIVQWNASLEALKRNECQQKGIQIDEEKLTIMNYITGYYSQVRPHQYNGGLTPYK